MTLSGSENMEPYFSAADISHKIGKSQRRSCFEHKTIPPTEWNLVRALDSGQICIDCGIIVILAWYPDDRNSDMTSVFIGASESR